MSEGLERALRLPVGGVYAEVQGGVGTAFGAYLRGELGYRPHRNVSVFGFGEATGHGAMAGTGVRVEW